MVVFKLWDECGDESESESSVKVSLLSSRIVIIDQYVGICDQGDKPKHVILPNFNKIKKILVF